MDSTARSCGFTPIFGQKSPFSLVDRVMDGVGSLAKACASAAALALHEVRNVTGCPRSRMTRIPIDVIGRTAPNVRIKSSIKTRRPRIGEYYWKGSDEGNPEKSDSCGFVSGSSEVTRWSRRTPFNRFAT